jgi:hypothetical protein
VAALQAANVRKDVSGHGALCGPGIFDGGLWLADARRTHL